METAQEITEKLAYQGNHNSTSSQDTVFLFEALHGFEDCTVPFSL